MTIDEFTEFYGYKKAARGKFATLDSYITTEKEKLREELKAISVDGMVQPQGKLYQRLYVFSRKISISLDDLIIELGFNRKRERLVDRAPISEKIIANDLEELEKDIELALKFEKNAAVFLEKSTQTIERNASLVTRLKKIYNYRCQLCRDEEWMPIQKDEEIFYSEVHHIIPLSDKKDEESTLDKLRNMIVVCPNHHKLLHFHKGGFRQVVSENNKLFFTNESGEKIEILYNYHLSPNVL